MYHTCDNNNNNWQALLTKPLVNSPRPASNYSYGCQPSLARANNVSDLIGAGAGATNQQSLSKFDSHPYDGPINFRALFWVDRGPGIWALQTLIAVICFVEALLMQYLTYKVTKGSILVQCTHHNDASKGSAN